VQQRTLEDSDFGGEGVVLKLLALLVRQRREFLDGLLLGLLGLVVVVLLDVFELERGAALLPLLEVAAVGLEGLLRVLDNLQQLDLWQVRLASDGQ
jgi:hypothetical protein